LHRTTMTFKGKLIAGLAAASAVLIIVAILSYLSLAQNIEDRKWVTHSRLVLEKVDDLQINVINVETSLRGYVITGDESYLIPSRTEHDQAIERLKEVRELTVDNQNQQRSLDRLELLLKEKFQTMQSLVVTRRQGGLAAGATAVREGSGRELMDQIRMVIASMKKQEDRLLVIRTAELDASSRETRIVIIIGEALGFFFLLVAGLVIQQEMKRRALAEEKVRSLNADLERRVAERTAELAERAKDLQRSNTELQQFAYVASHDLQEPLRTISSFTQLLAKRYQNKLDEKAGEFINYAVDGCKRMQTLINDLLAFSRVGTQGKPLARVSCDAALDRVLKALKMAIQDSGAVITRESLPVVLADEIQLCQLFQNLVGNAIKFRNSEIPRIHVFAERHGTGWKIAVRDNGIGVSPEHGDRIFVIFQRLHTRTQYPGTGIGLAICKKIAERHGGRIWVEPSPEGGSTFWFTIEDGETGKTKEHENHELRIGATAN
jgi:signal transduction histidine kinase